MFTLPPLPYKFGALEPYIDAATMEVHYTKHHQTYADKLNAAILKHPELDNKNIGWLLTNLPKVPEDIRTAVKNGGGGFYNHNFFWPLLVPNGNQPSEVMTKTIADAFGSFDSFKDQFSQAALNHFGSGWTWLIVKEAAELGIITTANQDTPISEVYQPILTLDVWEHAYYLKYQNRRADYIASWWNVVNWNQVEENYRNVKV
jgi:superoxide dismutase, Fe-Mn family